MFCSSCGKTIEPGVRFCPNCGAQAAVSGSGFAPAARLVRLREPRMIAGVCSGFALHYGWDVSRVRVVTAVIAILTSGFGGLPYLAAWIIIPEAPYMLPPNTGFGAAVPPASYTGPTDPTGTTGTPAV